MNSSTMMLPITLGFAAFLAAPAVDAAGADAAGTCNATTTYCFVRLSRLGAGGADVRGGGGTDWGP